MLDKIKIVGVWTMRALGGLALLVIIGLNIYALVNFLSHTSHPARALGEHLQAYVSDHGRDWAFDKLLDALFDAALGHSLILLMATTAATTLVVVPAGWFIVRELSQPPKSVAGFLDPLRRAMRRAARIELGDVEKNAWAVLAARQKVLNRVLEIYRALYDDFQDLSLAVDPEGRGPIATATRSFPIESNLKCPGGPNCHCAPGQGCHLEVTEHKGETNMARLTRVRSHLDRITSQREKIHQRLEAELAGLLDEIRRSPPPKKDDDLYLTPGLDPFTLAALLSLLVLMSLACVVTAYYVTISGPLNITIPVPHH